MSTAAELLPAFRVRFPEFDSETDERVTAFIDDALCIFALCEKATLYLAAHLLTLSNGTGVGVPGSSVPIDGGAGETTSESVGSLSVSVSTQSSNPEDVFYTSTAYGRQYLALKNACPAYRFSARVFR